MHIEIEHKYLVNQAKRKCIMPEESITIEQTYLYSNIDAKVIIYIKGKQGYIDIMNNKNLEKNGEQNFRYTIPLKDAKKLIKITKEVYNIQGKIKSIGCQCIRTRIKGSQGYIAIKYRIDEISKEEYEYAIPLEDAKKLIAIKQGDSITKTRHLIHYNNMLWEIDEFDGYNKGLIVAEIELENTNQHYTLPNRVTENITNNRKYSNKELLKNPYINRQEKR